MQRRELVLFGAPNEGMGGGEIRLRPARRRQALQSHRDSLEDFVSAAVPGEGLSGLAGDRRMCCFGR